MRSIGRSRSCAPAWCRAPTRRYLQVRSLSHRKRFAEAIGLAVESLCALGIAVPAADERAADLDRQFEHLYRWLDHSDSADDLARPEISDPALLAATRLIDAVLPGAYFTGDLATYGWLSLEGVRIWLEHGPGRTLIGPASTAAFAAAALRGDHAAGYRALRRILAVGEARGYEPDTSQARHRFDLLAWMFEPIENAAHEALRAREGLLAGGDPTAAYTYYPTAYYLLDCAPTLDEYIEVMDAALAFVGRIGSEHIRQMLVSYRWLAGVLRGEGSFVAGEAVHADEYADNPVALFFAHVNSAVGATVSRRPGRPGPAHGSGQAAAVGRPGSLSDRGVPPAARSGSRRGGHRGRRRPPRRAAGRAGRGDAVARRPRRGRAGELPAPAAAGRGRAGLGGRRLPRGCGRLRRGAQRGRSTAVAPGADRRTRGPLLPRPRARPRRHRAPRRGPPGVRDVGRDREGRPARSGLPRSARPRGHGWPNTATATTATRPSRPG